LAVLIQERRIADQIPHLRQIGEYPNEFTGILGVKLASGKNIFLMEA
jgi:hypothetical protein